MTKNTIRDVRPPLPKLLIKDVINRSCAGRIITERCQPGCPDRVPQMINGGVKDIVNNDKVFMLVELLDKEGNKTSHVLHYQWSSYKNTNEFFDEEFSVTNLISQLRPAEYDDSSDILRIAISDEPFHGINLIEQDLIRRAHFDRILSCFQSSEGQSRLEEMVSTPPSGKNNKKWLCALAAEINTSLPRYEYSPLIEDKNAVLPAISEIQQDSMIKERDISLRNNGVEHPLTVALEKKIWYWPALQGITEQATLDVLEKCLCKKSTANAISIIDEVIAERFGSTGRLEMNVTAASSAANDVYRSLQMIDGAMAGNIDNDYIKTNMWFLNSFVFEQNTDTDFGSAPVELSLTDTEDQNFLDYVLPDGIALSMVPFSELEEPNHHLESMLVLDPVTGNKQLERLYALAEQNRTIFYVSIANDVLDGARQCDDPSDLGKSICATFDYSEKSGAAFVVPVAISARKCDIYGDFMQSPAVPLAGDAMGHMGLYGHHSVPSGPRFPLTECKGLTSNLFRNRASIRESLTVNTPLELGGKYHFSSFNTMYKDPSQRNVALQLFRNRLALAIKRVLVGPEAANVNKSDIKKLSGIIDTTVRDIVREMRRSGNTLIENAGVDGVDLVINDKGETSVHFKVGANANYELKEIIVDLGISETLDAVN